MSDTPETDASRGYASRGYALSSLYGRIEGSYLQMDRSGPFVHAEVARKLERERDEAREEWGKSSMDAAQLLSEKTKIMAERDQLKEALLIMENLLKPGIELFPEIGEILKQGAK